MPQDELNLKSPVLIKKPGSPRAVRLEIAPGQTVIGNVPPELRPRLALVSWQPVGDGNYKPVAKTRDVWVKLTDKLPSELGLDVDSKTLRRLAVAGIIESRHPSPNTTELDLHSLDVHLEACRDPEYWITVIQWPDGRKQSRRKRYEESIG